LHPSDISLFHGKDQNSGLKSLPEVSLIFKALIREVEVAIKKTLWERLPAAKLNDRGWKPLPQPIQFVLSRSPEI
jgi:hypothetical protein